MKFDAPVKKNEHYIMKIDDIGNDGEGIGKVNGFTIFVEGALPGDEIDVLVVKIKKTFAFGKLISIITPSPSRIVAPCTYASKCGGCRLQHLDYTTQLSFKTKKVKDSIERIGGMTNVNVLPTIGMETPYRYRNKAQFPVRKKNNTLNIGFFAPRSHNIIDIDHCLLQHTINDKVIETVRSFLDKNNVAAYNEVSHKGIVRHILTKVGFTTGEIMVCIVINGKKLPFSDILVEDLKLIEGMASIVVNNNSEKTNVIMGKQTELLWGKKYVTDYIANIKFEISPLSFFQVNPIQTKILYGKALELAELKGDETILDIYCGIGTISLFFAQKAKKVMGVEIVPEAIEDAKRNAEINQIKNVEFRAGRAEEIIPKLYDEENFRADVVVVDPPRKGCEEVVLQTIINMNPQKIVYISCDPATLARDLKILCDNGFQLGDIQPVDQFCHTIHVETCVLLSHKNS